MNWLKSPLLASAATLLGLCFLGTLAPPSRAQTASAACDRLAFTVPLAFDIYQGRVASSSRPVLDQVADRLRACSGQAFELQVHTDTVRLSSFNLRQSQRVAEHVRELLRTRGLDPASLAPCGYGEEQPGARTPDWAQDSANNRLIVRALPSSVQAFRCRPSAR